MTDTVFSKIIKKEIPAEIVHETERVIAFKDITPQAPHHILIIPKKPLVSLAHATEDDTMVLGECLLVAKAVAERFNLHESGYRVVTNIGSDGGQTVFHLHFHLLGGRSFAWPPG